jgi:hypothetical protein
MTKTHKALIAVMAAWLFMGVQCSTESESTIATLIKNIQDFTASACSFVPTVDVILSIYNQDTAQGFDAIAKAICAVVPPTPNPTATSAGMGSVKGVPIKGWHVAR